MRSLCVRRCMAVAGPKRRARCGLEALKQALRVNVRACSKTNQLSSSRILRRSRRILLPQPASQKISKDL